MAPTHGRPLTRFTVSFTAPARTGLVGSVRRSYVAQVNARARKPGCVSSGTASVPPAPAHVHVTATLDPTRLGGRWCTGSFDGKVVEIQAPNCARGQVCPAYLVVVGTVGRFTFRVT